MNKKQATRTLGTIETKQSKQSKEPTQPKQTKKELNKDLEIESEDDDNIEASSFNEVEPEVEHNSAYSRGVRGCLRPPY